MEQLPHLPIDDYLDEIVTAFKSHKNLVLVAEPGAGKTTRVPPTLLPLTDKKILVLEPRRMAALAASVRIAQEQNLTLGHDIGYQVRFENKTDASTRLIFMTEALLARKILQDPELKDTGIVILDEFHERSQHVDLALGLLRESQELGADIKVLVMSATLDAEKISEYLGHAPIVRVPGKSFPLELKYDKFPQSFRTDDNFFRRTVDRIKEARSQNSGDILVFLPGVGEIHRCQRLLQESSFSALIEVLHGSLSLDEQRRVLKKSVEPRVILSTNIAESSVTLDGVGIVIDSGLNKINSWNSDTGFESLVLQRVSKSSATQRAGRAARQGPGICYRLWNQQDELSMKPFTEAEILRTNLTDAILWLAYLGVSDPTHFSWYQAPPAHHLKICRQLLIELAALNTEGLLTEKGKAILPLPLSTRSAALFVDLDRAGFSEAAEIAAILEERDLWSQNYNLESFHESHENDLFLRLELMQGLVNKNSAPGFAQNILRVRSQLRKYQKSSGKKALQADDLQRALLHSYPDRICRRRNPKESRALMASGRGVELDVKSQVKKSEFFIALTGVDLNDKDTRISMAAATTKDTILKTFETSITKNRQLRHDLETGKIWVEEFKTYRKIPLEKPVVRAPSAEEIQTLLPQLIFSEWSVFVEQVPELRNWLGRWKYYVAEKKIEDPINAELLLQVIEPAITGLKSWSEALQQNWIYFLEFHLPVELIRDFHKAVPATVQLGPRTLSIQYEDGQDPFIEARLQHFFGQKKHPTIFHGQVALRLILLGPHGRPVQITKDLPGFWTSSYPEIRKELKPDYPKHNWPEDPSLFEEPLKKG
jgi:ATP-dependent helicase HrpB